MVTNVLVVLVQETVEDNVKKNREMIEPTGEISNSPMGSFVC